MPDLSLPSIVEDGLADQNFKYIQDNVAPLRRKTGRGAPEPGSGVDGDERWATIEIEAGAQQVRHYRRVTGRWVYAVYTEAE